MKYKTILYTWVFVTLCVSGGCNPFAGRGPETDQRVSGTISKMVVVGFHAALKKGNTSDVVRDPFSGAVFMASPIPSDAIRHMNRTLFDGLVDSARYSLISPSQAQGVISRLVGSDIQVGTDIRKIFKNVGNAFQADAVLAGFLYRWRGREGTPYAVDRPASVAFDLHLIRPTDGRIIWRAKFDKTQRSLTENLFDMKSFFKSGGRWMTAEELGTAGLKDILTPLAANKRMKGN